MSETASLAVPAPPAPAGGLAAISKYNPHLWSAEQLRAIFVARQNELADLLRALRTTPADTVGQHVLLVGARGMGKSTLMQRLALAVEDDAGLHAVWLALRFPEEQYTVSTVGQFWANVLDSLIDALERQGQATAALDATALRIEALPAGEQAAACLAAINQYADERGQRLLLLVDNTDLLLHNIGHDAHWALRETLQSNPRLLWVGGSYQSLEADSDYHDAFLDFFRVIELRPLRLPEMEQALLALAATFGGDAAKQAMQRQLAAHPERLPTLRQLSGGNPRTTVMLYELFANGQKSDVRSDLEALLDAMTPLYKARMDSLADLPRKLLAHTLEHWAPIALGELAAASQVAKTSISPQLQRLELEGLIEKTKLHGTTRSGYQVAERFFNIWYLMRFSPRRQRARLAWLVEFMRLWFSSDELCSLAQQRMGGGRGLTRGMHDWEYDRALADALPPEAGERHALRWALLKQLKDNRAQLGDIFELDGEDGDFKGAADYLQRLAALPALLRKCPHAVSENEKVQWVEAVLGSLSLSLEEKEHAARLAADLGRLQYDQLLKVFSEATLEWEKGLGNAVAHAVRVAVLSHDFFPDMPDSKLAYEQIRACFSKHPEALGFVCELFYEKYEDDWCLKALGLAQAAMPQNAKVAYQRAWLLHNCLGRYEEAEMAYRQAIAINNMDAYSWSGLGRLLQYHLGRFEEAEAAYRQAITSDDKDATLWNNLGNLLKGDLGRYDEAEVAYRHAIALDDMYATPWNNLGNLLKGDLGRLEEAEMAYRQAIALDDKYASPWNGLGNLLQADPGRHEEAEAAYRQAIVLNDKGATPWNNLANLLKGDLCRYDEAEAAYHHAIALDDKYATPWNGLGNLLQADPGRHEEAEAAYRHAIALDDKYASPWNGLGNLLNGHLGRYEEAETAYCRAIALDDKFAYPWNGLGNLFKDMGRYEEAEAAYRRAIALDNKYASPWNGLGNLFKDIGLYEEAKAAYRQAVVFDDKYDSPWNNLGNLLQYYMGNYEEAEVAYRQAIAIDNKGVYPKANLARLLWRQGRKQEAGALYGEVPALAGTDESELLLQAHLCLGNRQLAVDALQALALAAQAGKQNAFYRLKEQVWECHELGLGARLAEWMAGSEQAVFLLPFSQALYMLAGEEGKLQDLPLETQQMADEVVRIARQRALRLSPAAAVADSSHPEPARKGRRRKIRP